MNPSTVGQADLTDLTGPYVDFGNSLAPLLLFKIAASSLPSHGAGCTSGNSEGTLTIS